MLSLSGRVTYCGEFTRRNGERQPFVEVDGVQVNLMPGTPLPAIDSQVSYNCSVRRMDGGRLLFTAVGTPNGSAAASSSR